MKDDDIEIIEIEQKDDSKKPQPKFFTSSTPERPKPVDEPKNDDKQKEVEQFKQRAKNLSHQAIKQIIEMNVATLKKVVNTAARNLPIEYANEISNDFIRYLYEKELLQVNQKGKDVAAKAKLRVDNKHLQASNEYSWLFKKLMSGEFEDSWISSEDLPELPLVDQNQKLFAHCVDLLNYLKSYQHVVGVRKFPGLFEFMKALENGKEGFIDVTCHLLKTISVFIHKNRKVIPEFRIGRVEAQVLDAKSVDSVHFIARKILKPSYQMKVESVSEDEASDSDKSDELNFSIEEIEPESIGTERRKSKVIKDDDDDDIQFLMEVEPQVQSEAKKEEPMLEESIDEEEVCERFCEKYIYELSPMEQVRVFELLLERVEVSAPVMDSIKNSDADVKQLKADLTNKRAELNKVKNQLKELLPMVPKEEYESGLPSDSIEIVKKNRKRQAVEDEKQALEKEVLDVQKAIDELQSGLRLRASPIGYDRFHRGYWRLPSTPGLIVEQGALTADIPDENAPLALPPMGTPALTMSTGELITFLHTLVNGGFPSSKAPIKWFHVNSKELLDELLKKLSSGGVRESQLKQAIKNSRADIEASFSTSSDA